VSKGTVVALLVLTSTLAGCAGISLESRTAVPAAPGAAPASRAASSVRTEPGTFAIARLTPQLRAEIEAEFLSESNKLRATAGVDPLVRDPRLDSAARKYAEHLARRRVVEHDSDIPELRTPEMRAAAEGAKERFVGETLALLASTPESTARRTVQLWSESPDHRRVMTRKVYHRAGIGIAQDAERVWYVVQMYAPGQ
jgi:uncharacterized protein YkwD